MRFLWYAVSAMCYLEYFLFERGRIIWDDRHMPSYLGPTLPQMIHLFFLIVVNSLTLFMVSVTFLRTVWGLGGNVTTIESWEIERHAKLLRRARALGGYLDGPDGIRIRITKQEFPYDIGIWNNIVQGMGGTSNVIAWLWPFSATPRTSGVDFETNGFEDPGTSWPPPDPDRMPRLARPLDPKDAFVHRHGDLSPDDEVLAFRKRQMADFERRAEHYGGGVVVKRRKPFHERFEEENGTPIENDYYSENDDDGDDDKGSAGSGEEGWQDSGGNRLKDYGVDEEVEFYDEDNIPIAELLRRRRRQGKVITSP
ncbi:Palmitoyltransferase [Exophiala oligosperma]